ncbi:MAG: DUF362 domain-containing protein [Dehalococcoidales bacterium]|nr:MAG: DUF362 domain-containing protein [Dehalococcoidales bacterium]
MNVITRKESYQTVSRRQESDVPEQVDLPRAQVSIVRASQYDLDEILAAVRKGTELIGGLEKVIKAGDRVFVKINHLPPASPPERGIVTHPIFAEAVIELLKEAGADITVGDDIESEPQDGFGVSGFRQMCQRAGVRLVNLREGGFVATESYGRLIDSVYLSRIALEADVIVNLPRLKTHSLTVFTGGIKNMYGVIPASLRREYHGTFIHPEDFSLMLTDVFAATKPQLTIMDGIVGMEGEGPANGNLRQTNVILASRDAVALDTVASSIIGLNPVDIDAIRYCDEQGLGVGYLEAIEVTGESLESVTIDDFRLPATLTRLLMTRMSGPLPSRILRFVTGQTTVQPRIVKKRCTVCGECVKICPTGAATIADETTRINQATCIGCLCCHEVCRYNAIALRRPLIGTTIFRLTSIVRKLIRR